MTPAVISRTFTQLIHSGRVLDCLLLKAEALVRMGMNSAAIAILSDCLRRTQSDVQLLKEARYIRAEAYASSNKTALARKDWEKLYADDPKFRDVAAKLK